MRSTLRAHKSGASMACKAPSQTPDMQIDANSVRHCNTVATIVVGMRKQALPSN